MRRAKEKVVVLCMIPLLAMWKGEYSRDVDFAEPRQKDRQVMQTRFDIMVRRVTGREAIV
jgi:hypothetical protein